MEAGRAELLLLAMLLGERFTRIGIIGRTPDEVLIGTRGLWGFSGLLLVDGYEPMPAPGGGEGGQAMLTADGNVDCDRAVMSCATRAVNGVSAWNPRIISLSIRSVSAMPWSRIRFGRSNRASCFFCLSAWESSRARMRLAFATPGAFGGIVVFLLRKIMREIVDTSRAVVGIDCSSVLRVPGLT